jgi:hypothetical protein
LFTERTSNANRIRQTLSLTVSLSIVFTSIFSLMAFTASAKNSDDKLSEVHSSVPGIKMIYDNKAYDMSTFVLANNGEMKKITLPQGDPPDDGSNPPIPLKIGSTAHFQFDNKQPTKVNAYIIDMEAQPVELYAQRQIGPNDFQIVGPYGILNFEVHAFFPDGQYTSQYVLANITSGASPTVTNLSVNPVSSDNGYIALSNRDHCMNADRLHTLQISSKSENNSNNTASAATVLDNNLHTAWTVEGIDVKAFVKSSLDDSGRATESSNKNPWLQLDLGADKTVCNIGIAFPNGDKSINFFKVQTSTDGQHFTDVGAAESYPLDSGGQLFTFPDMPDKARYIRISDVGNLVSGETEIAELMAAGK